MINSDGSSTCCAPGGPCSTSPPPKPFTLKAGQIVRHKVYTGPIGGPMDPTAFIEEEGVATGGKDGERWIIQMNNGETRYLSPSEMVVPIVLKSGGVKKALQNYDIVGGNPKTPKTAGVGKDFPLPAILIVGGFLYYAYTKGLLTKN
tara:strand:- start:10 stop:450 length:441 start_codon:yes stop_codon:yes gene_type:complete